jgi:hypothetical protein
MSQKLASIIIAIAAVLLGTAYAMAQTRAGDISTGEIRSLIAQAAAGTVDPGSVITGIALGKDRDISILREVLRGQKILSPDAARAAVDTAKPAFRPMKEHRIVIKALEEIGSAAAYNVVLDAALAHEDLQVRGLCLSSLASAFHVRAKAGRITPEKNLIYLYFSRASDTLMIEELGMRVGDIARLGIKNWTAKGGSRPVPASLVLGVPPRTDGQAPYWERWWASRSAKIKWDNTNGLFVLPN